MRRILLTLAALSGMCGIAAEVLYLRHLTAFLGDMFYVHAALLGVFLALMGLGARLAHLFPRRLYAFELAAGVYALALPGLSRAYQASALYQAASDPALDAFLSSLALLAVPAFCAGASLPLLSAAVRAVSPDEDAFPAAYAFYNLGACASVLAVEFILVRGLGISGSLYALGLTHLFCGAALWAGRRGWTPRPGSTAQGAPMPAQDVWALGLAGLAGAAFQGFYLKTCYHLFLPHRENFALCTGAALLAIALGALWQARRRPCFADCLLWATVSLGVVYAAFPAWAMLYQASGQTVPFKLAFALILDSPMVFLGAALPALLRREGSPAGDPGRLLFVSGLANALGYAAFVFLLHQALPLFAVPAAAALCWLVAALRQAGPGYLTARAVSAGLAGVLIILVLRQDESLVYAMHMPYGPEARITTYKSASDDATYIEEGRLSSITHNGHPSILVRIDGKVNPAEVAWGLLPALAAPRRDSALVIGMGTGMSAGALARVFRRTDVVEINRGFFGMLTGLKDVNFGLAENPGVRLIHDDGRRFLARARERYDLVMNSVPTPTYLSAGKLYTAEYFGLVKSRLKKDGVFCFLFSVRDLTGAGARSLLATAARGFRHGALGMMGNGYYMMALSDSPVEVKRLSQLRVPADILDSLRPNYNFAPLEDIFAALFLPGDILYRLDGGLASSPMNTDDLPYLEFEIMRQEAARPSRRPPAAGQDFSMVPYLSALAGGTARETVARAVTFHNLDPEIFQGVLAPWLGQRPDMARAFRREMLDNYLRVRGRSTVKDLLALAELSWEAGEPGRDAGYCREAVKLDPLNTAAHACLARCYQSQKAQGPARRHAAALKALTGL